MEVIGIKIAIDKNINTPIYLQIFEQIRGQILRGELMPGFKLPPERKLADSLGVNRSTVLNAYRELKAEGFVESKVGNGTIVLACIQEEINKTNEFSEPTWNHIFSQYSAGFDSHMVKDLLALASRKDVISFATGIAAPESGPIEALEGIERDIIENRNFRPLLHSPTEGFVTLRSAISGLMHKRGVYCSHEEVMILSGSQQGIDIAARVLLDPGDIVVAEEPTFFPAVQAFKATGARIMGVPVDENGMRIDDLEQLLQRYRPKLIYTMPSFHNPSGVDMDLARRRRLIELANRYRILIMEDDAYGDLCYEGHQLPLLKSMDGSGYVIYISTFSKNVYSGLRLGWMVAHKKVVTRFAQVKQIMDLHSSSLSQAIIEKFILNGGIEKHISKLCKDYKYKRDAMCDALSRFAPAGMTWTRPKGGYYVWCNLPEGISATDLVSKAAEKKVVFVPGTSFYLSSGQGDNQIRLNFTYASLSDIAVGVRYLCEAIKELTESSKKNDPYMDIEINPIV
ncbi:PLP-dependent aminotransferase family protein [Pseudobacteroides cellulosolvens]|uniref:Transcriptional regulator, GntR family with aminotransferase domain containing protein n=1 Tax=Pseudobacteroides cellulosolvens ATCC 35603 = DSM 2933 TaxID=398512 RepID=A0A0L6JVQ3_9FIRM|nr:PLP-dependent aminotransferase family protein [Pseudobacteroides cellulosolvens]KNY29951.1 transcriptional regulator, GntR family with aminotransferase domain containing protein [Pseudobacteroides cellulosolvens ATCC 35603 = DSM 2933]